MSRRSRILFVAMANSPHTVRWLAALDRDRFDVHLFPVDELEPVHPSLRDVTVHRLFRGYGPRHPSVLETGFRWPLRRGAARATAELERRWSTAGRAARLARTISRLKPDLLHTLEMQHAGYLALQSRTIVRTPFPRWIYSSWGSDLFYYGRLPEHERRVRAVLAACDFFIADCERDIALARELGFNGEVLGAVVATAGFDLESMRPLRQSGPVSARTAIALKGLHTDAWVARGLIALQAVHLCADELAEVEIVVYSASPNVRHAAEYVGRLTGLDLQVMPPSRDVPYSDVISLLGRARIAVAVNISDGTPIALLEAMIMGAFPIQSDTVSTREWITDGRNGLLVDAEDPASVAAALRRAVSEDALVDSAAELNNRLAAERLDRSVVVPKVLELYERVLDAPTGGRVVRR